MDSKQSDRNSDIERKNNDPYKEILRLLIDEKKVDRILNYWHFRNGGDVKVTGGYILKPNIWDDIKHEEIHKIISIIECINNSYDFTQKY